MKLDIKEDNIQKNRVIDRNLPFPKRVNTIQRSQEKDRKICNKNNLNTKGKDKNSKLNKNIKNRELTPLENKKKDNIINIITNDNQNLAKKLKSNKTFKYQINFDKNINFTHLKEKYRSSTNKINLIKSTKNIDIIREEENFE